MNLPSPAETFLLVLVIAVYVGGIAILLGLGVILNHLPPPRWEVAEWRGAGRPRVLGSARTRLGARSLRSTWAVEVPRNRIVITDRRGRRVAS